MIRIAILEDEQIAIKRAEELLSRFASETGKELRISAYTSPVDFLENRNAQYDIILLDIEMPYYNGLEVAQRIRSHDEDVIIIFVTNMAQYALKGYQVQAYDFLVKPVTYPQIETLMARVVRKIEQKQQEYHLTVKAADGLHSLAVSELYYIEVIGHRLIYHTASGNFSAWGSLKAIEAELAPYHFVKCNACYLVNLKYVSAADKLTVTVADDALAISQSRKKPFMDELTAYLRC